MARPVDDVSEKAGRAAGYSERAVEGAKEYASDTADRIMAVAKDAYANPEQFARETRNQVTRYT